MAAPYPTVQNVKDKVGANVAAIWAKALGDTAIQDSCDRAWGRFRSAARVKYTEASIDALTAGILPDVATGHILADAIADLASADNRPDHIDVAAQNAKEWRSIVAAGKEFELDSVLTRITTTTGGTETRVRAPKSFVMDFDDPLSPSGFRDGSL